MSFQKQTAEFIATVAQNLPEMSSDIMQGWIENPKALQKLLGELNPPPNGSACNFKVWKTIRLGTGQTNADGFRNYIKDSGMRISDWANDILGKPEFVVTEKETEVDLVVVSVAELGFKKGATLEKIYARAKELGLEFCSPDVGPQLRLQYKNQPLNEWLRIGMNPIRDSGGCLRVFSVGHDDDGLWLNSFYGFPDDVWRADARWVFVRPRK